MKCLRLIGRRRVSALVIPMLWLLVSGCSSIEKRSSEESGAAATGRVLSTNPMPVEIEGDHLMVGATLNGHEVRLVLDTGATDTLISPEAAGAAGIIKTGRMRFSAFGSGRGVASRGVARSMAVGPALAEQVAVGILPLPAPLAPNGLLGLSFLRRFTFRLDYEQKQLSFASSENSNFIKSGVPIPLQDQGYSLAIEAEVDGIPAKFIVDTGSSQSLILRSWFVEQQKLRERYPRRLSIVTGMGLLGKMRGEMARLQSLKLGDHTITNLFAEFESKTNAWPGDFAGFIGAPILRRFNLTFDTAGKRLWVEPNGSYAIDPSPPASVRSGLVCLPEGTNWIVQDVVADSPAATAGVGLGDRLLEIEGVSVQSLKLAEIRRAFRAEPGTRVRLRLQAAGENPRDATLILRDLL
jgi:predicted aspartyl protease